MYQIIDLSTEKAVLHVNLKKLVNSLLREFTITCKKVAIYGPNHPSSSRAIEKPFLVLNSIFKLKKYVNINLQHGQLFILNICLKDSVFSEEIIRFMQILDLDSILFKQHITMGELQKFIERFVKRVDLSNHENLLSTFLNKQRIESVEVNSEIAYSLFDNNKKYLENSSTDFSVKNIILRQLPDDLETLCNLYRLNEDYAYELGIDFEKEIVRYLIPEKVSFLSPSKVKNDLLELIDRLHKSENNNQADLSELCKAVFRLIEYHPEQKQIYNRLEKYINENQISWELIKELQSPTGKIKMESWELVDKTLNEIFIPESDVYEADNFIEAFERLINTGDRDKVKEVSKHLVDLLSSSNADFRQKALGLLLDLIKSLNLVTDLYVFEGLIDLLAHNLLEKKETYEYSEFIWQLLEKCFKKEKFYLMSQVMAVLSKRRRFENEVTIYDSMAVKKVFANFNQPQFIDQLIQKMLRADFKIAGYIRDILIYDGSEEVALALSNIISHPQRRVRQQALKILAELGKASLKVFSQILVDDDMFEREQDRHELPDNKWYIIRNSIFVLGLLKDPEATVPLRLRINDTDIRVRREIISALEKIGGEEACDILMMMADDPVKEIREKAVITIGFIGTPETVPLLIDLVQMNPKVVIKAISAMGRIGGEEAENFLVKILEDEREIIRLASGMFSKDDVKLAIIKALGNIGSKKTINKVKDYKNKLPTAQKIFFKNSPVNKAIDEILSKQ